MIDPYSAACVARAADKAHEIIADQIAADPTSPIVDELQRIADQAEALSAEYASLITALERRPR